LFLIPIFAFLLPVNYGLSDMGSLILGLASYVFAIIGVTITSITYHPEVRVFAAIMAGATKAGEAAGSNPASRKKLDLGKRLATCGKVIRWCGHPAAIRLPKRIIATEAKECRDVFRTLTYPCGARGRQGA
jgi:hypothetical protein